MATMIFFFVKVTVFSVITSLYFSYTKNAVTDFPATAFCIYNYQLANNKKGDI